MNEYVPPLTDIKRFADVNKVECVFPVPETFIHSRMSENGLQYWSTMRKIIKPLHKNNTIKKEKVIKSFSSMCEELHNKNDMTLFDAEETYIKVTDWNTVIKYDIKNKTFEEVSQLENDISMSSECLCFLIENKWGRGTVLISGRCQINYDNANNFFNQTNLCYYTNIGKYLGENLSLDEIVNQDNFYEIFMLEEEPALEILKELLPEGFKLKEKGADIIGIDNLQIIDNNGNVLGNYGFDYGSESNAKAQANRLLQDLRNIQVELGDVIKQGDLKNVK